MASQPDDSQVRLPLELGPATPADRGLPAWARGCTSTQGLRVLRGLHPLGFPLRQPQHRGETCGSCRHLRRKAFARTYLKCELATDSNGPATDVRARWPGCDRWKPGPTLGEMLDQRGLRSVVGASGRYQVRDSQSGVLFVGAATEVWTWLEARGAEAER